ncbi:MAG: hypothetical protein ACYC6M_04995 [Terriglobales bacterium]
MKVRAWPARRHQHLGLYPNAPGYDSISLTAPQPPSLFTIGAVALVGMTALWLVFGGGKARR